ncbi:MAG: ABC transporter permease, partial [Phycisphaerae bacterium]
MTASTIGTRLLLPTWSLWRREVVRFVRQRGRVIGALGTPVVFWLLIGSGLRNSFRMSGGSEKINYLEYAFPGTIVLIVLFTAIFSTISIIEDRREGFLQGVLAAPVARLAIVLGKVLGSSTLAVVQSLLFLALAPLIGVPVSLLSMLGVFVVLVIVSLGLSALGFLIAWPMDSTQGFHSVMNLFLMPMWLLSGAFFPATGASSWLGWVMRLNPLTYGVALLRRVMYWGGSSLPEGLPSAGLSVAVTVGFAVVTIL